MEFTTIQWNIGGAKLLRSGTDPSRLASYDVDGLREIIALLRQHEPDIITLQETHASKGYNQARLIAEALGYAGRVNDDWADSHIEAGQRLGQAIICREALTDHNFTLFRNPRFTVVWEDGTTAASHDKSRTRCTATLADGRKITIERLHTSPLHRFAVPLDSLEAKKVFLNIADELATNEPAIIQADFNINSQSLAKYLPTLFKTGVKEIPQISVTTPKGKRYDHVLYKGLRALGSRVYSNILTDHYPIVTRFKLPET